MYAKSTAVLLVALSVLTYAESVKGDVNSDRSYTSPFRYVIVYNNIREDDDPQYTVRRVEVLLDQKAFSKETLTKLFRLIAKRFPKPENLDVDVYTSLEQVDTPEEKDAGQIIFESRTGQGKPSAEELNFRKYPSAILMRQRGNELFRYTVGPDNLKLVTVVLKGKDPMP